MDPYALKQILFSVHPALIEVLLSSSLRTGHSTFFLFRKSYQQMEPTGPRSCWLRHCKFFQEQPRANQEIKDGLLHGSSGPLSLMATSDCFNQVRPHLVSYLVSISAVIMPHFCLLLVARSGIVGLGLAVVLNITKAVSISADGGGLHFCFIDPALVYYSVGAHPLAGRWRKPFVRLL